ncbi:hypothetical protein H5410_005915 [Solanum commersonii]|uniref:Uncharacterized protein n=1 Tax=Solanum commersonii TaxID=4109 RepID=A0A9J6A869_SOLCO|nr:hypothetical protein H5410_005915 [Solanum commersonii]
MSRTASGSNRTWAHGYPQNAPLISKVMGRCGAIVQSGMNLSTKWKLKSVSNFLNFGYDLKTTSQTLSTHTSQLDKHLHKWKFKSMFHRKERNAPALITRQGTVLPTGNKGSSVISSPPCSSTAITSFIDKQASMHSIQISRTPLATLMETSSPEQKQLDLPELQCRSTSACYLYQHRYQLLPSLASAPLPSQASCSWEQRLQKNRDDYLIIRRSTRQTFKIEELLYRFIEIIFHLSIVHNQPFQILCTQRSQGKRLHLRAAVNPRFSEKWKFKSMLRQKEMPQLWLLCLEFGDSEHFWPLMDTSDPITQWGGLNDVQNHNPVEFQACSDQEPPRHHPRLQGCCPDPLTLNATDLHDSKNCRLVMLDRFLQLSQLELFSSLVVD